MLAGGLLLWFGVEIGRFMGLSGEIKVHWEVLEEKLRKRAATVKEISGFVPQKSDDEKKLIQYLDEMLVDCAQSKEVAERATNENSISFYMRSIFRAVSEYEDVLSDEKFIEKQSALMVLEDEVQKARKEYNARVRLFNSRLATQPHRIAGMLFGIKRRQYFELHNPTMQDKPTEGKMPWS